MDEEEWILLGALAFAAYVFLRSPDVSAAEGGDGGEEEAPTSDDVEALARVMTSELGSGSDEERRAIGWCVRERASIAGKSIYDLEAPAGQWGEQGAHPPRPFSSRQPANARDTALATDILLQPLSKNPYPDAAQFFEPGAQDTLYRNGVAYRQGGGACKDTSPTGSMPQYFRARCYFHDAQSIRDKWQSEGASQVATVGRIELWSLS